MLTGCVFVSFFSLRPVGLSEIMQRSSYVSLTTGVERRLACDSGVQNVSFMCAAIREAGMYGLKRTDKIGGVVYFGLSF